MICSDWKWNIINPRNLNRSSTRLSLTSITFPHLHQWSEHLYTVLKNISLCRKYKHYAVKYIFRSLAKQINKDLSNLSYWLRANKFYLNIQKTELIIFHPTSLNIDHSIKFKLQGKQLTPPQFVKYLGVLVDEHLQWTKQLSNVKIKLNRAIGILSKLRDNSNLDILKITYHSLFGSHFLYACHLWAQKNQPSKLNPNTSK